MRPPVETVSIWLKTTTRVLGAAHPSGSSLTCSLPPSHLSSGAGVNSPHPQSKFSHLFFFVFSLPHTRIDYPIPPSMCQNTRLDRLGDFNAIKLAWLGRCRQGSFFLFCRTKSRPVQPSDSPPEPQFGSSAAPNAARTPTPPTEDGRRRCSMMARSSGGVRVWETIDGGYYVAETSRDNV
jgi:hypothetical protein